MKNGHTPLPWKIFNWSDKCGVTSEPAVLSHDASLRKVMHMLTYKALNAPTQEAREQASRQLVELDVLLHKQPEESKND